MSVAVWLTLSAAIPLLVYLYVRANDAKLSQLPPQATALSPSRWTAEAIQRTAKELDQSPPALLSDELPPKTGRRYIVVGGAGFLGGWIVLHLLARGEDPRRIRVLDIRPPVRNDLLEGPARKVDFMLVDIGDAKAVDAAFQKEWPTSADAPLTVFHTAATIRFYERHPALQPYSDAVNLEGTKNIVEASRKLGASTLVYTSSGSISVRRSRFWLWPWQKEPEYFVQPINDDDALVPKRHELFFSNYAVSKSRAERVVRAADKTRSGEGVLRTGCIRPGNGIYGPGGDMLVGLYLLKKVNPTWIANILQSFIYVENCSLAHLCYEQRLIELEQGGTNPDIGGQAFCVADAGPAPTYGEVYKSLNVLTCGETVFPEFSPTFMLAVAHLIEFYYLVRYFFLRMFPPLSGDIVFLQPSMFALTQVHLIFDDSRARASAEKGGLNYNGHITTIQGVCKVVLENRRDGGSAQQRVIAGHVSSDHGVGPARAEKGVREVIEKIERGVDKLRTANLPN
ncbi:3beta-hydroxysteroid-dehydrogenase/decarboxylase isoform 2 [Grifola frondosa]|uniref:3beta-hydroxysteroid-dehydrogenase/decarboxylase isoform 2 n=1 Tax=Grifola frondosa TaxID=5627 RepID=A0A1C7MT04_GRIFR|nr:3beta-hydroxysteroid-dehydrogenase/decarboxylase isoform 2 [Grifola frondosa]